MYKQPYCGQNPLVRRAWGVWRGKGGNDEELKEGGRKIQLVCSSDLSFSVHKVVFIPGRVQVVTKCFH